MCSTLPCFFKKFISKLYFGLAPTFHSSCVFSSSQVLAFSPFRWTMSLFHVVSPSFCSGLSLRWNVIPSHLFSFHPPFKAQHSYWFSWEVFPNNPPPSIVVSSLEISDALSADCLTLNHDHPCGICVWVSCWIVLLLICTYLVTPSCPLPLSLLGTIQGILQKVWWGIECFLSHYQSSLIRTFRQSSNTQKFLIYFRWGELR